MIVDYVNLEKFLDALYEKASPFQKECIEHLIINNRCIIDSLMGTGKTMMALAATMSQRPERILVLCSKNAFYTWQKETKKWFSDYSGDKYFTYVRGQKHQREKAWRKESLFYVCTYQSFWRDVGFAKNLNPDVMILDEFHKGGLRNKKTQVTKAVRLINQLDKSMYPMSGSTNRVGPQNMWNLINILAPKKFPSYWGFLNHFCRVIDGAFGKEIIGVRNTEEFAIVTRPYFYKIPDNVTASQLPPLLRSIVDVDWSPAQARHYKELAEDMYTYLTSGEMIVTSSVLTRLSKLRQLLVCPKIVGIDDYGAGIEAVKEYVEAREDHHCVIFTPFRDAVTHFKKYVYDNITKDVFSLWGGDEPEVVKEQSETFKKKRGVMVATIQFAQSYELETCDNCHLIGFLRDQNENAQAEGRLRRMSSDISKTINAYYYRYPNTIDDDAILDLDNNTRNINDLYQDIDRLKSLLRPVKTN
jgi:hypothetical protein